MWVEFLSILVNFSMCFSPFKPCSRRDLKFRRELSNHKIGTESFQDLFHSCSLAMLQVRTIQNCGIVARNEMKRKLCTISNLFDYILAVHGGVPVRCFQKATVKHKARNIIDLWKRKSCHVMISTELTLLKQRRWGQFLSRMQCWSELRSLSCAVSERCTLCSRGMDLVSGGDCIFYFRVLCATFLFSPSFFPLETYYHSKWISSLTFKIPFVLQSGYAEVENFVEDHSIR